MSEPLSVEAELRKQARTHYVTCLVAFTAADEIERLRDQVAALEARDRAWALAVSAEDSRAAEHITRRVLALQSTPDGRE